MNEFRTVTPTPPQEWLCGSDNRHFQQTPQEVMDVSVLIVRSWSDETGILREHDAGVTLRLLDVVVGGWLVKAKGGRAAMNSAAFAALELERPGLTSQTEQTAFH